MSNLALIQPARTGTVSTGVPVANGDKILRAVVGSRGVLLEVINGNASPDVVTISDASRSASDGPAAAISTSVANGTSQVFKIVPAQVDPVSGDVTIGHTVTATVTCKLYPL